MKYRFQNICQELGNRAIQGVWSQCLLESLWNKPLCGSTQKQPISIYAVHAQPRLWGDCDCPAAKPKQGIPQLERGGTPVVAFPVFSKRKRELDDNISEQNFFLHFSKNVRTCSGTQLPWVYSSLGRPLENDMGDRKEQLYNGKTSSSCSISPCPWQGAVDDVLERSWVSHLHPTTMCCGVLSPWSKNEWI